MRAARGRLRVDERGLRAGLVSVDDRHRGFAEACAACSLRRRCRGVFAGYLARRGAAGWPVSREVPNSFNWEPQGRRAAVAAPVPRAGRSPRAADPRIFVRTGPGTVRRHAATTRTSDETIRAATQADSRSTSTWPGAGGHRLPRELRHLRLAAACPLPRAGCAAAFERDRTRRSARPGDGLANPPLARGNGAGRRLRIGAVPRDSAAVRAGRLRYTGLDPRGATGPRAPGFELIRGTLEAYRRGPPFDTVMSLRSVNHLRDARAAGAQLAALTAPGGRTGRAEGGVFGSLRPAGLLERIPKRDDLPFEHRLNLNRRGGASVRRGRPGETSRSDPPIREAHCGFST